MPHSPSTAPWANADPWLPRDSWHTSWSVLLTTQQARRLPSLTCHWEILRTVATAVGVRVAEKMTRASHLQRAFALSSRHANDNTLHLRRLGLKASTIWSLTNTILDSIGMRTIQKRMYILCKDSACRNARTINSRQSQIGDTLNVEARARSSSRWSAISTPSRDSCQSRLRESSC